MPRPGSTAVRFAATLAVVLFTLFLGWMTVKPWSSQRGLTDLSTKGELQRAFSLDPRNPSYHYRLGLHNHYDPDLRDLGGALEHYLAAIGLNPANADYWVELSRVYEGLSDTRASARALSRALALAPTDLKIRWMTVSHWLRKGDTVAALRELTAVLRDHPGERRMAFNYIYMIAGGGAHSVLVTDVSGDDNLSAGYLYFLMETGDTEAVKTFRKRLEGSPHMTPGLKLSYMGYLISRGEMEDAKEEWARYKGISVERDELVWNGGFEEDLENGAFGWKVGRVEGAVVETESAVSFKGDRSLGITFDGKANVNFRHVRQAVPLEPDSAYTLSANVMTGELTTTNGIFIQIRGINGCRFSAKTEALTGTNDWRELSVGFETPPGCNAAEVTVRRAGSEKLDNLIGGMVRIDGVSVERNTPGRP